jgi:copper chaperone CopZ
MEELTLPVPGMWADHHVLAVREALLQDPGIKAVVASARDMSVQLSFDASQTDQEQITARLSEAGYRVGEQGEAETIPTDKPAWASCGSRVTATDPADLIMSGDHRKY